MRVVLVHLSDLHLSGEKDEVLSRSTAVVEAVRNFDYEVDALFLVITGDVAYSGSEEQYVLALDFVQNISRSLSEYLAAIRPLAKVFVVGIPGNHDCDFTGASGARDLVLTSLEVAHVSDVSVVDVVAGIQQAFFSFLDAVTTVRRGPGPNGFDQRIYYEFAMKLHDRQVRFLCCN